MLALVRRARSAITKQSSGYASHGQARARSAIAKQSSGCADHGQACAQCFHEAVERVCLPWSGVRACAITKQSKLWPAAASFPCISSRGER